MRNLLWLLISSGNITDTKYFDYYLKKSETVQVSTVHEGQKHYDELRAWQDTMVDMWSCLLKHNNVKSQQLDPCLSKFLLNQNKSIWPNFYLHLHFRKLDSSKRFTCVLPNGSTYQDYTVVHTKRFKGQSWQVTFFLAWLVPQACQMCIWAHLSRKRHYFCITSWRKVSKKARDTVI